MIATDTDGWPYALVSDVKEGDVLIADCGFDCMVEGERLTVRKHADGRLFIECGSPGGHAIDGQEETICGGVECQPFYMGLYKAD